MTERTMTEKDIQAAKEIGVWIDFEIAYMPSGSGALANKCSLRAIINGEKYRIHTARGEAKWYSPVTAFDFVASINGVAHFTTRLPK